MLKMKLEHSELTQYFKNHLPKVEINGIGFRENYGTSNHTFGTVFLHKIFIVL